ncbi:MAG TPA: Ig-like domain-containing protein, partial [Xanthomonadales bacterium]|nr:Ig-like domain-containing protein [Xanthomonadales bacterium]
MMLLRGVGTYDGYGGFNGIYADWSALSDPIVWDNAANATVQSVGGSSISNVQRLLVKSGAGDDDIRNTAVVTDDEFVTGAGHDTIYAGGGKDRVDAGAGDDFISVVVGSEFADTVHGGTGNDTLIVTAVVPETSPWMSKNMYFTGYDAQGAFTGQAAAGSATMANADAAMSGVSLKLNTANGYPGVMMDGIENLSLMANPSDDSLDMLFVIGNGTYNGYAGVDALYANWSGASADIVWNNLANATPQPVSGSTISNVERLLVRTGSGNDDIRNTAVVTDDELETGPGNDTIHSGGGKDRVDAGVGDDFVSLVVGSEFADAVHGGDGIDTLLITAVVPDSSPWQSKNMSLVGYDAQGVVTASAYPDSSFSRVTQALGGVSFKLNTGNGYPGVSFDGVERLSLVANPSDDSYDLLVVLGSGTYSGGGGADTLYADWSATQDAIVWNNLADASTHSVNGSLISGVERLLLKTGAGSDDIRNLVASTHDEIETGAGQDTVHAGAGNDRIHPGAGNDIVDAGAGTDTAVFTGNLNLYSVTRNASGTVVLLSSAAEGSDRISNVETFQFADGALATSALGGVDSSAPAVLDAEPADEATGASTQDDIVIRFGETIERASGTARLKNGAGDIVESFNVATSARITVAGDRLTLDPSADLASMTSYRVEIDAGSLTDRVGNAMAAITGYNFTTGAASYNGTPGDDGLTGDSWGNTFTPGLGNDRIDADGGVDTVVLPMFPNVFTLTESSPGQVTGSYAGYTLVLNDVEFVQFGRPASAGDPERFQTTIALSELVSGAAQLQLGRLTDLYLAFFGRAPDVSGLEYW